LASSNPARMRDYRGWRPRPARVRSFSPYGQASRSENCGPVPRVLARPSRAPRPQSSSGPEASN